MERALYQRASRINSLAVSAFHCPEQGVIHPMSNDATAVPMPDWNVRLEPAQPPCPHCRMLVVRATTSRFWYYFCECEMVSREQPIGRPVGPEDFQP